MFKKEEDFIRAILGEEIWAKGEWGNTHGVKSPNWSYEDDAHVCIYDNVLRIIGLSYANYGKWNLADPDIVEKVRDRLTRIVNNDWGSWKAEEF